MNDFTIFGTRLREVLQGLLGVDDRAGAIGPPPPPEGIAPDEFPRAGIDLVHHLLRVQLDIGATGRMDETLQLYGQMLIQRDDPYVNEEGRRQIDFRVMSWVATGWSWVLRQSIAYTLSPDVEQPTSTIIAEQQERDFPATFRFNVIFDARANNQIVLRQHHGRPEGGGFLVVPPDGDRRRSPTLTQFEIERITVAHPLLGDVQAHPLDCNDSGSSTLVTF
jgi:hypothetical protein